MFEITPIRIAIGNGWFTDYPGPTLELEFLTSMLQIKNRYFHGSLLAIYFEFWKEEGEIKKEISGDFLYLKQFFDRRKKDVHQGSDQ